MALHFYLSSEESDAFEDVMYSASSSSNQKKSSGSSESFGEGKAVEENSEYNTKKQKKTVNFSHGTVFRNEHLHKAQESVWETFKAENKKQKVTFSEPLASSLSESDFETTSNDSASDTDSAEMRLNRLEESHSSEVENIFLRKSSENDQFSSECSNNSERIITKENEDNDYECQQGNVFPESHPLEIFDTLIQQKESKEVQLEESHGKEAETPYDDFCRDYEKLDVDERREIEPSKPLENDNDQKFYSEPSTDCNAEHALNTNVGFDHTGLNSNQLIFVANQSYQESKQRTKVGREYNSQSMHSDEKECLSDFLKVTNLEKDSPKAAEWQIVEDNSQNSLAAERHLEVTHISFPAFRSTHTELNKLTDGEQGTSRNYQVHGEFSNNALGLDKIEKEEELYSNLNIENAEVRRESIYEGVSNNSLRLSNVVVFETKKNSEKDLVKTDDVTSHDVSDSDYMLPERNHFGGICISNNELTSSSVAIDDSDKIASLLENDNIQSSTGVSLNEEQESLLSQDSDKLLITEETFTNIGQAEMLSLSFGSMENFDNAKGDSLFEETVQSLDESSISNVLNDKTFFSPLSAGDNFKIITSKHLHVNKGKDDSGFEGNSGIEMELGKTIYCKSKTPSNFEGRINDGLLANCKDNPTNKTSEAVLDFKSMLYDGPDDPKSISNSRSEETRLKEESCHNIANEALSNNSACDSNNTDTEILRNVLNSSSSESYGEEKFKNLIKEAGHVQISESDEHCRSKTESSSCSVNGSLDLDTETVLRIQNIWSVEDLESIDSTKNDSVSHNKETASSPIENHEMPINNESEDSYQLEKKIPDEEAIAADEYDGLKRTRLFERLSKLRDTLASMKEQLVVERENNKVEAAELVTEARRMEEARQIGMMMDQVGNPALGCRAPAFGWGQAELVREQIRAKRMVAAMEFKARLVEVEAECSAELTNLENAIEKLEPLNRMASHWLPCPGYCAQLSSSWMRRDFFMEVTRSMNVSSNEGDLRPPLLAKESEV